MNGSDTKLWRGKTMVLTVVALAVGILIGAVAVNRVEAALTVKQNTPTAATPAASAKAGTTPLNEPSITQQSTIDNWNPFQEMRNMQAEMDRMFQRSIQDFNMNPQMDIFKNETGYSSSLDVRNLKNRYEIHAYLPDANVSNAKVKLDGNQLTVQVSSQQSQKEQGKNESMRTQEWGSYDQTVQLAGNLKDSGMKVTREPHELLITIPKANS